jgi:hypothetical protein
MVISETNIIEYVKELITSNLLMIDYLGEKLDGKMNKIINEIIHKYPEEFQSEDYINKLSDYIKPTFKQLHAKYAEI